ncbi:hypothetical protein niasHS_007068 [Heterodera schachtii]|uniref:DDE-1 domain-containing protein n=1 Tax=Heterodera schachtii TaxID=97005 RepID=A0ABD2JFD3_HETSC
MSANCRATQLLKRIRPAGKLMINFAGSIWMNDDTTEDYLHKIIGAKLFVGERLLVWDAFGSHKSERKVVKELGVETVFIPGGCTKFIQAPDVSWNKPFKERIRHFYNIWMSNEAEKEFTSAATRRTCASSVEIVKFIIWACSVTAEKELCEIEAKNLTEKLLKIKRVSCECQFGNKGKDLDNEKFVLPPPPPSAGTEKGS